MIMYQATVEGPRKQTSLNLSSEGVAACTMRVGLIDNAWWNSTVHPVEGVKLTKKIGYDTYDLYPLKMPSASERKELRQALEEVDLPCYTIIAPVFSLSDPNAEISPHTV